MMKRLILCTAAMVTFATCKKETIEQKTATADAGIIPADYLSSDNYDKLKIEIQSEQGMQPTAATVTHFVNFLQQRLNKPGGIEVVYSEIGPGKYLYNLNDVKNLEMKYRSQHTNDRTLTAYIVFVNADYSENSGNSKVLGIAYGASSMVVFEKTIRDYAGGLGQPSLNVLESTVTEHEFGHSLGLVNNGTKMKAQHQDVPNGRHCTNTGCLMYYAVETTDIVANLLGNSIPSLDSNCISDLQGNGGK